jgi:hypothetical protein
LINVQLPTGYHLNPTAPQRYSISIAQGSEQLKSPSVNANSSGKGLSLPLRVPFAIGSGTAVINASFTFVYCREDNTGVCRIKTLVWRVPVEIVNDPAASAEINLLGKVAAE